MTVAPDGSPVELYALLPELGEGDRVAQAVPNGGSILELGCGVGRITRQLIRLGYAVTAVDESAEMLAHVQEAETIHARIEQLDLGRRFDAALLASNLINAPAGQRRALLDTSRRHADLILVEGLPLSWRPEDSETQLGDVRSWLRIERIEDAVVHARAEYSAGRRHWHHSFAMRVFADQQELDSALAEAHLRLDRWLDSEGAGRWFVAVPA
jgi:SAM-dependent methyltransferase